MTSVCVAGAGTIGSLFAAFLARVCDVSVLTRREDHARALNEHGLRVSGRAEFTARVRAAANRVPTAAVEIEVEPHGATAEARVTRHAKRHAIRRARAPVFH